MAIHKGTELNNVNETWKQNEKLRAAGDGADNRAGRTGNESDELRQAIKEEAAEYDRANKEDRLLDGERATVNDDLRGDTPGK